MTGPEGGPAEARIWRTETVWGPDGKPVTTTTMRTEAIVEAPKGPEWRYQGVWGLTEYIAATDRVGSLECMVRLDPAKVAENRHMTTLDPACPAEFGNIAGWYPAGEPIGTKLVLVDGAGGVIGDFTQRSGNYFRGEIMLASGRRIGATFTGYGIY